MAALCTVASAAAAAQHVANFPKSIGQVSVQAAIASQSPYPRKVLCTGSNGRLGDRVEYSGDDGQCSVQRMLRSKHFSGDGIKHARSSGARRKSFVTKCEVRTAVVEQTTELKVSNQESSSSPIPNSKPSYTELNVSNQEPSRSSPVLNSEPDEAAESSSSDQPADELLLRPAPRPAPRPRPKLTTPPASQVDANPASGTRWTPKLNETRRGEPDVTYKQVFRPRDKTINPSVGTELKSPIDSLGQILEKAEKLNEQTSTTAKENRYVKSTWRKGDVVERSSQLSQPKDTSTVSSSTPTLDERVRSSGGAEATTSATATTADKLEDDKLAPPRQPLKLPAVKPPNRVGPQLAKPPQKQIILRDVGAAVQPPTKDKAASLKPGSLVNASAAVEAPAKPGKTGLSKTKDGKEDWRKKQAAVAEGLKRRMASKVGKTHDAVDGDLADSSGSARRSGRKMTKASRKAARAEAAKAAAPVKVDILEVGKEGMSIPDLAQKLAVNDAEIVKTLFMKGISTTVTQTLDEETVKLVCQEFEVEVVAAGTIKVEDMATKTHKFLDEEDLDHLQLRPPVITIMGHVDHGKTSLLDYIRKTKVAASEAGGITQGVGAYRVPVSVEGEMQTCVFLDTPGHEAFSAMRARGAQVTDIAIIVVAADDGVRPQTQEAIAHAKAANVPIVVAINKIDKDGAEPERVMQELSSTGLLPEDWGGDVPMVQVSALKGQNVDTLLETVMLVAEFQELKANPNRSAKGTVIESCLHKARGVMATLLVQNGTLKKGDVVHCGEAYGKVRALLDDTGARVNVAGPSTAVQVIGLSNVPVPGEQFEVLDSLEVARERAERCGEAIRLSRLAAQAGEGKVTLSSIANSVAEGQEGGVERHQLNVVLKVDVQGTLGAIREALLFLPQDTVNLRMLMQAAGDVTISDVDLAIASEAVIIGFNVGVQSGVQTYAESKGVEIRLYRVIYELLDDIRSAMEGLLDPLQDQVSIGTAEVRAIFNSGSGRVAGCMVTEGKLVKECGCNIVRGGAVVGTGNLSSLRRVRELAKEVIAGLECGIGIENFNEWQEGDIIEAFKLVAKKRTLEEASVTTASSLAAAAVRAAPIATMAS